MFTKVGTNCINAVAHNFCRLCQTIVMPRRHIVGGGGSGPPWNHPWARQEETWRGYLESDFFAGVLKVNFEKVYNNVWSSSKKTLCMIDFRPKWCDWIACLSNKGVLALRLTTTVTITPNGEGCTARGPTVPTCFIILLSKCKLSP